MNAKLESVAARAADGWQRAGSKFDFEVFAMPGGSVLAPALWICSMVASALKRTKSHSSTASSAASAFEPDGAIRACGEKAGLHCDWSGCHCT